VNGKTIDGVTSIIGAAVNKPALVYWAANKAAEYIEQNLVVGKAVDEIEKKNLVNGCKTAHRTMKNDAADYGKILHGIIEKYIKKEEYEDPTHEMLLRSFQQFQQWEKDNNVEFIASEKKAYSRKYSYAGTYDFQAIVNGKKVIGDLKTNNGIYPLEMGMQLAAYIGAVNEEWSENIDTGLIVNLRKDGTFETRLFNSFQTDYEVFLAAKTIYSRTKEIKNEEISV
jgi:cytochrome c2